MPLQTALETALTRTDARSDDRQRKIAFADRSVVIARRVAGIAMRVQVPLTSYQGVRLSLGAEGEGATLHTVELLHRDPDLSVPLFQTADPRVIANEWCAWANSLSLPRLFEDFPADSTTGESVFATPLRRRGSAVAKRRSRFARRRKTGAQQRLALSYSGEREIISYE
ncbi:MAG: hypothetical protein QOI40_2514 [Alphaproteobacteria bacterium]|jgi:hypothetical protein|nr:hypothetical protein [Alphaproteobacteria bacterium]